MKQRDVVFFDIETGPLPIADIQHLAPEFKAPGNYKDPQKIAAYIEEERQAWYERAALSATTGRVLAIGVYDGFEDPKFFAQDSEPELLKEFLAYVNEGREKTWAGFCTHFFDWPFVFQRAWKHGLQVPFWLRDGRYWSKNSLDLQETWQCGNREMRGGLDLISKFLGGQGKTGNGADFAKLFITDKGRALDYLANDLRQTEFVYNKLFIS